LIERLALVETGADTFESADPVEGTHVFGGHLVAQALRAATQTVDAGREVHSLHASFVSAGAGGEAICYEVERTRDGSSFTNRRVTARQAKGVVLVLTADFHADEPGVEYAAPATPGVPGPDGLDPGRYDNPLVESRDVPPGAAPGAPAHARHAWFRCTGSFGDDPADHAEAIAFLSDFGMTRAAREPHAHLSDDARRQSVSLDHSVWFHRPVRADQWLLSELVPMSTGRGRGLAFGTLRTQDGTLAVSYAQEVLLRER
jgi:acyl-CoA thioesterase-2